MKYISLTILFTLCLHLNAQTTKKLTLVDETTKKAVPFANILFNETQYKGTTSDIDGVFYVPNHINEITISYVGYATKILKLEDLNSNIINLKPQDSELDEVVISGENPAHRIIKLATKNKDLNNPKNLKSYTYKAYDKIYLTSQNTTKSKDSILSKLDDLFEGSHLFITETITKHKYLKPRLTQDSIIATKSSGFKNPNFSLLANSLQPFSFYDDHLVLVETNYLNPISKGSTRKYKFRLKEEIVKDNDTLFVISFEPKANRNFEGLKGVLTINSNKYAVQSVDAKTVNSGKIGYTIQQKYALVNEQYWFPEQLNFIMTLGSALNNMAYYGKSYISDISLFEPLTTKDFSLTTNFISEDATKKSSDFWRLNRRDSLDLMEQKTYAILDSIGEKKNFDKILTYIPKVVEGRFPLKYVDIDVNQLFRYNNYEGFRTGLGLYTNDDIIKNVFVGGYGAYGFKDHTWKYGFGLYFDFSKEQDFTIDLEYKNDLLETGSFSDDRIKSTLNQRGWIASQMDAIESYSIKTNMKLIRNVDWSFGFNTSDISPQYGYAFNQNSSAITDYTNTEIQFGLTYRSNEKVTNMFGLKIKEPSDKPVVNFLYARGLENTFDGDFSYNKFRFTLDHSFITKGLGKTTYRLDLGYIDKTLPYGLLFTGEGSFDRSIPFVVTNYFQTMRPYEFLSDRYASLFTTHNFGRLFNNKGKIAPEVVLYNNFSIGELSNESNHQFISFKTKEELFSETGLELQNFLKVDVNELFYLSFGVGAFYRYGFHNLDKSKDNFAFKYGMQFSFK